MPQGFSLTLGVYEFAHRTYLREAQIRRPQNGREVVRPGIRSWDGSYTELELRYADMAMRVRTGTDGDDLLILVEPLCEPFFSPLLVIETAMLWNRPGTLQRQGDMLQARLDDRTVDVFATASDTGWKNLPTHTPYLSLRLDAPVAISTGRRRSLAEVEAVLERQRNACLKMGERHGELAEVYRAMQTGLAWNTIFEPSQNRVVSTVSRAWNADHWGGYVLFCWDTYFAALMAAVDHRDLAYANLVEMTRPVDELGFVPNCEGAGNNTTRDRSQPPIGAITAWALYQQFGDEWVLKEVFDRLLQWNRWWTTHREHDGLLAWGSHPYDFRKGIDPYRGTLHSHKAAANESGLDNSPMYDDAKFDTARNQLQLADVGLMGLYIADCRALAKIAGVLGRREEEQELLGRAESFTRSVQRLWNEPLGIFCNLDTQSGAFSERLSPTCFYPMLGCAATPEQVRRMVNEHLLNPNEFWGPWVLPSISRSDPTYVEQEYWRGRIWAPMNFLVYLGLREYDLREVCAALVQKSQALLMKEWAEHRHVHENYNAETGEGCDVSSSDAFYHWGGLLGLMALLESRGTTSAEAHGRGPALAAVD
jgi:glycogen debranching enzyme